MPSLFDRKYDLADKHLLRERWESHEGENLLRTLKESNYDRSKIELLGRAHGRFDLRGAPLKNIDFSKRNISLVDFYAADLRGSRFCGADLTNSHLSEADIRGVSFNYARMENTFLDNARYDRKTTFVGVDIRAVNFNLAVLLQEQARDQQRIDNLKGRHPILSTFLWATCDYGQSFIRFLVWYVGIIIFFAGAFYLLNVSDKQMGVIDAIYFSVTTFTTLGFGDITPNTVSGKILVILEVLLGYIMGGLLVAILVRRIIGN